MCSKAIFEKEYPYSGCWCRIDQKVIRRQVRNALQSCFNRRHRRLPEREALLLYFVAPCDDRMSPLPGHLLGPPSPRLGIDQLRPMPRQLQDPPTPFNRMICAVIRRRVQELHRRVDEVCQLHQTREKLPAPATALWTIVHLHLDQTRLGFLLFRHGLPRGFDRLDDAVTRVLRAATGEVHRTARFLHHPTRHLWLLAPPIVITGSMVTSREPPTRKLAAVHGRFPIHPPAFDAW